MPAFYSSGRTLERQNPPGRHPAGTSGEIQFIRDEAVLTGVGIDDTVEFRHIPEGSIILTSQSVLEFDDLGTGGTIDLGIAGSTTEFCSAVNTDSAAGKTHLDESTTNPATYVVPAGGIKPLLTRKTAAVTGSPVVKLTIALIPPRP